MKIQIEHITNATKEKIIIRILVFDRPVLVNEYKITYYGQNDYKLFLNHIEFLK